MCGISGAWRLHSQIPLAHYLLQFEKMPCQLSHRGPDHVGIWHDDDIFLGHARLKIIDLSRASNQPLFNEDQSISLLLNGEIYNFRDLRLRLVQRGHHFRSEGDGEVIVHLYEEYGDSFVNHLDGMFALSLWDQKRKRLILARDRTGKKPLFYTTSSSFFFFASEIKAFFPIGEIEIKKNEDDLPRYFVEGHIAAPKTFYKNIYQLEPAHLLICEQHHPPKKVQYWDLKKFFENPKSRVQKADAIVSIRDLLKNAVIKRLVSDVPLGVFLSGGIDSTIVTAIATEHLQKPLQTFSIGFEGDLSYDESPFARIASQRFQTKHQEFHLTPQRVPELFDQLLWHYDAPFADSSAIPTSIVSQLARQHVSVVLTGDGGDENFGGYERFVAALWMEKAPATFWKTLRFLARRARNDSRLARALEAADLSLEERLTRWTSYFYKDLEEILSEAPRWECVETTARVAPGGGSRRPHAGGRRRVTSWRQDPRDLSPLSKLLYLNFKNYLANDLNVKMDRASMMHSLETRAPFLDHHLIEYCASLPDSFKINGFQTKHILKEAYKDILPAEIVHRRKAGFGVPLGKWFRGPLKAFLIDKLSNIKDSSQYLNPQYVEKLLHQHFRDKAPFQDHSMKLWNILMFHTWNTSFEKWVKKSAPLQTISTAQAEEAPQPGGHSDRSSLTSTFLRSPLSP